MSRSVLHVVTGLGAGGAERFLARLLPPLRARGFDASVVALRSGGSVASEIERAGFPLEILGLEGAPDLPRAAKRLSAIARERKPSLVQGWMYHGNLGAWIARRGVPGRPLVWSVRQGLYPDRPPRAATRLAIRLGATLSSRADRIVYNGEAAARAHEAIGYDAARRVVIPNGFDLEIWRGGPERRAEGRQRLGLDDATPVVGLVARAHPVKDHETFGRAAARLAGRRPDVRFVLAGRGVVEGTPPLEHALSDPEVRSRAILLGEPEELPAIVAAFDVATVTSRGEAFPNVLAEAMAVGVQCVSTDVGEAREILGETGVVVPVGDDAALATAWDTVLGMDPDARRRVGEAARARVAARYDLGAVSAAWASLYESLLNGKKG